MFSLKLGNMLSLAAKVNAGANQWRLMTWKLGIAANNDNQNRQTLL